MSTPDYRLYIQSDDWKHRRKAAILRSQRDGWPCCEVCHRSGTHHKNSDSFTVYGSSGLQVHHVHYRNLGQEEPEDLIVLCTDALYVDEANFDRVGCHERVHDDREFKREVARIAGERWG